MSEATGSEDGKISAGKIEFLAYHRPGLINGDYQITVTQVVEETAHHKIPSETKFTAQKNFNIAGERFALKPSDIHAVFPPDGSLGEHSRVLPHIILNRSTLPWERKAEKGNPNAPWLALLLFDDEEKPKPQILTLRQLKNPADGAPRFPALILESGQYDEDKLTVIDVQRSLLKAIMPIWQELGLLAHVRLGKDADDDTGDELAVIIANRLPQKGRSSTVHLVSVEDRHDLKFDDDQLKDDNFPAGDDDYLIRLVSLKSWSFACEDENKSFKNLLLHLNRNPSTLRLPKVTSSETKKVEEKGAEDSAKKGTKKKAEQADAARELEKHANEYLAQGCVLLPHYFRQGDRTASWYHGPLVPVENTATIKLPVRAADELVRYDSSLGMFDVSYAAAWELGRLLALQDKQFSTGLYRWKRTHAQQLAREKQQLLHPHLLAQSKEVAAGSLPEELSDWFGNLSKLKGVPFNYLVPDERMLPPESIRFFQVDRLWIDCLLDGAFSIGRVTSTDHERDQTLAETSGTANPYETVAGCLLRSEVVAGWPGLLVDAYDPAEQPLNLLRMERLSPNVLLCLFEGGMRSVAIHQKPETLHFGLDESRENPSGVCKKLRDWQGEESEMLMIDSLSFPWRTKGARRVVNICKLSRLMEDKLPSPQPKRGGLNSAEFALQMIEGVEKVVFKAKS